MRYFLLTLFLVFSSWAFSQNHTLDSLYNALSRHPQEDTIRVRTLLRICHIEYTSYPEKSKLHSEEALEISRKNNYRKGMGEAIRYMGLYHWSTGDFEQATQYAYETLKIFEDISYLKGIGLCYQLLGTIHKEQGDFDKAERFHTQAIEMFRQAKDNRNMGYGYNALGILFLNSSRFERALDCFQKSLKIREEIKDKDGLSQSYVNLATVYTRLQKYDTALEYFMRNEPIIQELDNKYRMAVNYSGMGELYMFLGDYNRSEFYLLKATDLAKIIHYKKTLVLAYDKLIQLEKKRKRFESALNYLELKSTYRDSIYNEEQIKQIAEVETRYETEKKDQKILLLERDNKIRLLWTNILIAIVLLLIILSVVIYLMQRYRERKNRLILNLEIDSLTTQRKELSEKYKDILTAGNVNSAESVDQRLLKKAIEVVEKNMADPLFGVEKMAKEIGMSRTNMHRKIKAITGFPPSELIRSIRLRKAALLLMNQADSVSQISLAVGYDDHSYFSKTFKKQFGVVPSEYLQSTTGEGVSN